VFDFGASLPRQARCELECVRGDVRSPKSVQLTARGWNAMCTSPSSVKSWLACRACQHCIMASACCFQQLLSSLKSTPICRGRVSLLAVSVRVLLLCFDLLLSAQQAC
jgi:hypothetical protein